jgi:hypothetical protein
VLSRNLVAITKVDENLRMRFKIVTCHNLVNHQMKPYGEANEAPGWDWWCNCWEIKDF